MIASLPAGEEARGPLTAAESNKICRQTHREMQWRLISIGNKNIIVEYGESSLGADRRQFKTASLTTVMSVIT
jgi:hypothetical protein